MSALEDAKALVAHLEEQEGLEVALEQAGDAHIASPSEQTLAAHNAAAEALVAHRAKQRTSGLGPKVGGDAYVAAVDAPAPSDAPEEPTP